MEMDKNKFIDSAVKVFVMSEKAKMPVKGTSFSACYDVSACFHHDKIKVNGTKEVKPTVIDDRMQLTMFSNDRVLMPTGLTFVIPPMLKIAVNPRSGMAFNAGVSVVNAPGTVDADYNRELFVLLINHSDVPVIIRDGDRIAQIEFVPVTMINISECDEAYVMNARNEYESLSELARKGGIGHTGK